MIRIFVPTGRAINRAAFLIDAVADYATRDRTGSRAQDCSADGVTTATVVADDATGERTERAASDGALLSVGPTTDTAGQESAQGER